MRHVVRGVVIVIVMFALTTGLLYVGRQAMPFIKLGLDLDGGVSITYRSVKDNPNAEEMSDAVYKL